jgi:hypothetical protein
VIGESMGGEQALAAVGSDLRVRAVVAEGATGQQLADRCPVQPKVARVLPSELGLAG